MAEYQLVVPYHANAGYNYVQPWVMNFFDKGGYAFHIESVAKSWFNDERLKKG